MMSDQLLKLIEKNNKPFCFFFGQFQEKFESLNSTKIGIITQTNFEKFQFLYECLDAKCFENDKNLTIQINKLVQNVSQKSLTFVKFEKFNEQDNFEILIKQLLEQSEELKNQTNTVIIELPTMQNKKFKFETKFDKTFISTNKENKNFLFFTNEKSLIILYEKL